MIPQATENGHSARDLTPWDVHIPRRLRQLPDEIEEAEQAVVGAELIRQNAQCLLEQREAYLILGADESEPVKIDGRNAEQREAQLLLATLDERNNVLDASRALETAKIHLRHLLHEFSSLRVLARWMTTENG